MPNVTMSQIAEAAGVSQATVSFVLNGRERANGSISADTAERVQKVAQQLGYRPNRSARALATGRSNLIGLCMWNLAAAHYAEVTRQVESRLQTSNYHLLVSCLKTKRADDDPQTLQEIFPWPLDGVLALEAAAALTAHWNTFQNWPAPIVNMGGTHYEMKNLDYVGIDLADGVRQAVAHLVEAGCRRIAFATHQKIIRRGELRLKAYAKAMQRYGRKTEFIPLDENSRDAAREGIKTYINQHGCPDGILNFNDEVALGCYRALCELKIKVPREVALVGCDGIEDTKYLECPITTIVQPVEEMCRAAWQMLRERIKDPGRPFQQKVLLPELAVRESTFYFGGKVK
jgi:DNA-binding LacI/PurR family transcriptional regulator